MFSIPSQEKHRLLQRFPSIELSYETIPHTKVSPDYNMCLGIPVGTKGYAWLSFYGADDVCFLMELNKERNITVINGYPLENTIFNNGTLFYGTIVSPSEFVIEDIFVYQGIHIKTTMFADKLSFIEKFLQIYKGVIHFYLPFMWPMMKSTPYDPLYNTPVDTQFHHIQYRCLTKTAPYLNVFPTKKGFSTGPGPIVIKDEYLIPYRQANFSKPQYKQTTVFKIMADIQFDIYRLFAYGPQKKEIYYNVAYISNYKTSVMMNRLFRKIKENENLDAVEESEDEEDFENIDIEKYVDTQKSLLMECRFHMKFKKWVPIKVVDRNNKVVHISQL
jgi:hypothetical protein